MRYLRSLLITALLSTSSWAAIAFGITGKNLTTSGTNVVTVTINSGDTVIIVIAVGSASARTVTVVDSSGSNTYTQRAAISNTLNAQGFLWGTLNVANTATTVTVTVSGAYNNCEVIVGTYTGAGTNGWGATKATVGSGNPTTATGSLVINETNNFVVAGVAGQRNAATLAFSASVGNLRDQQIAAAGTAGAALLDNTAGSGSVTNSTTTNSGSTSTWAMLSVDLRSATLANSKQVGPNKQVGPTLTR